MSATSAVAWSIAIRWTDRALGLVSTIVLARLLFPADFGLLAMAAVLISAVDALFDVGVGAALIQNPGASKNDFDTAWTFRLLQQCLVALVLGLLAPFADDFFREPRVTAIIWTLALGIALSGLTNIGTVTFQKDLDFASEFRLFFAPRMLGFASTLLLAWLLRSYWALVLGTLITRSASVGASYLMCRYRPQFTLRSLASIWSFSQWNLLRGVASTLDLKADKFAIGRSSDPATVGAYSLADEIAAMPTSELLAPMGRVMFPAFARLRANPEGLRRAFVLALGLQAIVALPAGLGLSAVAPQLVPVLLGPKWEAAVLFMQIMGVSSAVAALVHAANYVLLATGGIRALAAIGWTQFGLSVSLLAVLPLQSMPETAAMARLAVVAVGLGVSLIALRRAHPIITIGAVGDALWRPLLAAIAMHAGLTLAWPDMQLTDAINLAIRVSVGAVIYAATIAMLWTSVGRPRGAERFILEKARRLLSRSVTQPSNST